MSSSGWRYGRCVSFIYNFSIFMLYGYTLYADLNVDIPYMKRSFGGKLKYLTFINFVIQTVYFFICSWKALMKSDKSRHYWSLFSSGIVFPVCMFVSVVFWILYFIDREIILPRALDSIYPLWINHMQHSAIVPLLIIERFLTRTQYPDTKSGVLTTLVFSAAYLLWITIVAHYNKMWLYPFLDILGWFGKAIFFLTSAFLMVLFYFAGVKVNRFFWSWFVVYIGPESAKYTSSKVETQPKKCD